MNFTQDFKANGFKLVLVLVSIRQTYNDDPKTKATSIVGDFS